MEILTPIQPPVKSHQPHQRLSPAVPSLKKKNNNNAPKKEGRSTLQNITNSNGTARTQKFAYVEKKLLADKDLKQGQTKTKAIRASKEQLKDAIVPFADVALNELLCEKEEEPVVVTAPSPSSATSLDSSDSQASTTPSLVPSSPPSPIKTKEETKSLLQYDRDFLLSFKDKPYCKQTPPGKLPAEIIEEYNQECSQKEKQQFLHTNSFVPFIKEKKEWKPKSQVQAINKEKKDEEKQQVKKQVHQLPKLPLRNLEQHSQFDDEEEEDFGPSQELNQRRLETRQRQLDIGKNTPGYQNYIRLVPKDQRKRGDPQTPHKHQICSKRSWDGQIRKWRRMLHAYDPEQTPSPTTSTSSPQS